MRWNRAWILLLVLLASACSTTTPRGNHALADLAHPPQAIVDNVAALMPGGLAFIEDSEREILRRGRRLNAEETCIALAVGVAHPEQVRVLVRDEFIEPRDRDFIALARKLGIWDEGDLAGRASGHGIQLRTRLAHSRKLLAHELTHVAQYERLGNAGLLRQYFTELLMVGYERSPIEDAARANERLDPPL